MKKENEKNTRKLNIPLAKAGSSNQTKKFQRVYKRLTRKLRKTF